MSLSQLTVTYAEIQNLVPYVRNARTHSRRQIRQIADSIRTFGFTNPVLVNNSRMIMPDTVGSQPQNCWASPRCRPSAWTI